MKRIISRILFLLSLIFIMIINYPKITYAVSTPCVSPFIFVNPTVTDNNTDNEKQTNHINNNSNKDKNDMIVLKEEEKISKEMLPIEVVFLIVVFYLIKKINVERKLK